MKIVVIADPNPEPVEEEPVVETYLQVDGGGRVFVTARLRGNTNGAYTIAELGQEGLTIFSHIGKELGFALDTDGKLVIL